ncbi:universal stress protein [Kribbella sp. NPDC058245]|uniref:universal stress protein n=1 Tax=Kribbella sp. NPDC058245 TaxID=3346399 RepID=UPI0036E36E9D
MSTWNRTGPIVVEVDGSGENLRVVDYAVDEALRSGADLALVAPYSVRGSYSPMLPAYSPKSTGELADDAVRRAVAHIRHRYGYGVELVAVTSEGSRPKILAHAAKDARMLVVGRSRSRGPQRLMNTNGHLMLAARSGCPVVVVPMSWKPSLSDRKIAVGIDGTPLSAEALEFAFAAAAARQAELVVVHAGLPAERAWTEQDPDDAWISRADQVLSETLSPWTARFPTVKVTRFLSSRQPAAALIRESAEVGLVVVGAHSGALPIDPVARRSVAAMTSPVAIVPHHPTEEEHAKVQERRTALSAEFVVPTY